MLGQTTTTKNNINNDNNKHKRWFRTQGFTNLLTLSYVP
jgi:hypothetical protein